MARVIINNTKFTPFSFDEMLKPLAIYGQEYRAQQDALSELAIKSSVWEGMANEQTDPYAYKVYKKYADDLEMQAGQLAREGLSLTSRQGMLQMKQRYSKEIVPIETAYKRREELAAEQRKALAQNPTMLYQRMASTMSLDDFIKNPSLDYGQQYSGALITQQVSSAAANLAKEARDSEEGRRRLRKILPYQYELVQQNGFSREAVMKAILNSPDADKILTGLVEDAITSSGVKEWGDAATQRRAYDYARQGLYSAIGQTQYQMITDQFSMQDALHARQVAAQKAAEERQRQERLKMYNINPTSLYGTSEVSAKNKATLDELNKWRNKGYIRQDGKLTVKGWTAIKNQLLYNAKGEANSNSPYVRARAYTGRDAEFMAWANKHGVKYTMPQRVANLNAQGRTFYTYTDPVLQSYGNMTNYYNSTRNRIDSGQLVTGTPNIDVYRQSVRDKTAQEYLLNKTTAALAGGNIYQVGNLSVTSKGVTMGKGKGISAAQFRKLATDNPILYVINSPTTNNQLIELADGTKYIMPKGIMDNISQANISEVNTRLANSGSPQESAVLLNQANSYLGTLLNYNEGTGVSTNDGTITF